MKAILPLVLVVVFLSFPPAVRPVRAAAPAATLPAPASGPVVSADDLPRVKPTEPADAAATFSVRPGFAAQLVAAEPDVIDPIALCFDADGRMFVVEMRDYSERRNEKLGRIRMLEDADNDGRFEKSTVFLENLPWPTAVMCVNGGVLVGATPDIIFAKDTTDDGVADETKTLFTGFGATPEKLNVQGLFNNFQWGLDNRIHGCSGSNGGLVRQTQHPDLEPLDVRGKGFVIDPSDWSMTTEFGGGQYGLSFDPTGKLYTCSNSVHIETFMYEARYAARNPHATLPESRICIAADGPAAEVYRTSPEEPWRVIRTRWRVAGISPGMIEGGGRSAGYFTGATGVTIYKGDVFGAGYVGDAFIGDAGGNLVHHKRIETVPGSVERVASRPPDEMKSEFLASSDNWFRPVDFANTPDGTLYVCDMYRETIEHPWSIPSQIKQFLDLDSGNDRGRIWRLAPTGFRPTRRPPRLGAAETSELVESLSHPNGWHRETASRLLFERKDKSVVPLLEAALGKSNSALGRMHALHVLDGLGALEARHVVVGLGEDDSTVREHAVVLAERFTDSPDVAAALLKCADDPSAEVRYQLAFTLGQFQHADRTRTLAKLARRDAESRWARAAVLSSLADGAGEVFADLGADKAFAAGKPGAALLRELAEMVGAQGNERDIGPVAAFANACDIPSLRFGVARALAEGAARTGAAGADRLQQPLEGMMRQAQALALDGNASLNDRRQAIGLLAFATRGGKGAGGTGGGGVGGADVLVPLLDDRSQTIQLAALAALDQADSPTLATEVLARWSKLPTRVKADAVTLLLKRPSRAKALVAAIAARQVPASALDASQVGFLHKHADAPLRALALEALKPPARRDEVVERFRPALSLAGDSARGKATYQKLCISCHRADGEGSALGPDFVTVRNAGGDKLLLNILDPSREVANNYIAFIVETKDGQSVVGVVTSDTPAAVTVRQAYGRETVIPRANIKRMTSQGKSLMPDGLEEGLRPQDVADLIRFIETSK